MGLSSSWVPMFRRVLTVSYGRRARFAETFERSSYCTHSSHAGLGSVCSLRAPVSTALLVNHDSEIRAI